MQFKGSKGSINIQLKKKERKKNKSHLKWKFSLVNYTLWYVFVDFQQHCPLIRLLCEDYFWSETKIC